MMRRKEIRGLVMSVALVLTLAGSMAGTVRAAVQQSGAQPQAAQNEFVPLKDLPKQEQLPAAPLVMGAYAVVWLALLVYVWSLWRRVGSVQAELTELRRRVAARK
jgi:CcmD family protein